MDTCPECGSAELTLPSHSEPWLGCADCGWEEPLPGFRSLHDRPRPSQLLLWFYLGTCHPHWLTKTEWPLFVSIRSLRGRTTLPRALGPWALDSGGFTELSLNGVWETSPAQYAAEVRRCRDEIGRLRWASPQDWMCEPFMVQKTGLSVAEHQRRTVVNLLELRSIAPDLPWIPVLQGWRRADYLRHVEDYARAGIDLAREPLVGLGSVCRRQGTDEAEELIRELHAAGLRLHGFGFKLSGLRQCAPYLASADSMAWSLRARRSAPLPQCKGKHKSCSNCIDFALWWCERVLRAVRSAEDSPRQKFLFS